MSDRPGLECSGNPGTDETTNVSGAESKLIAGFDSSVS